MNKTKPSFVRNSEDFNDISYHHAERILFDYAGEKGCSRQIMDASDQLTQQGRLCPELLPADLQAALRDWRNYKRDGMDAETAYELWISLMLEVGAPLAIINESFVPEHFDFYGEGGFKADAALRIVLDVIGGIGKKLDSSLEKIAIAGGSFGDSKPLFTQHHRFND